MKALAHLALLASCWTCLAFATPVIQSVGALSDRQAFLIAGIFMFSAPMAWFAASALDAIRGTPPTISSYLQMGVLAGLLIAPSHYVAMSQSKDWWIFAGPFIAGAAANLLVRSTRRLFGQTGG